MLLDLALGQDEAIALEAAAVLKTQVFLYEADTDRLAAAYKAGHAIATDIIKSYAQAEFFTNLPDVEETIDVVTYVAGVGDISTDLLSPGSDAHSRSDRELHGKSMFEHDTVRQNELLELQKQHPDKRVMLVAEKGTMGVGSSRMSGVNNVALWIGKQASEYVPFINIAPVVAGTNGISPIFLTTVGVTGGIGVDLKNWVKKVDSEGNTVLDADGEPVLEQVYSVDTGSVFTINTKTKKLCQGDKELIDISASLDATKDGVHACRRLLRHCVWQEAPDVRSQDPRHRCASGLRHVQGNQPRRPRPHGGRKDLQQERRGHLRQRVARRILRPRGGEHCGLTRHDGPDDVSRT